MKYGKVILGIIAIAISATGYGQCSTDAFMDKCASALGSSTFIKSYEIKSGQSSKDKPNQFSYVFSKGSTYMVVICDQNIEGQKMIVTLYDRDKKMIASNYNKKTKKFYPTLTYNCSATGVYYLDSYFEGDKTATCGVNILGFNKPK